MKEELPYHCGGCFNCKVFPLSSFKCKHVTSRHDCRVTEIVNLPALLEAKMICFSSFVDTSYVTAQIGGDHPDG